MTTEIPKAKDIAKELDRRARRRKLLLLIALGGAIALAVLYGTCGRGWGLGAGKGSGAGDGIKALVSTVDAMPARCAIRVAAAGITVDAVATTPEQVVEQCKRTPGADVVVTGDAREGDWAKLKELLVAAKIDIALREPR